MAGTKADVIIAGVAAKLVRDLEGGAYKRRTIRREIQNNLLSQAENPALQSRGDLPATYQTSWAGGARWWKPLITPQDLTSYFQANHMATWSEPGKVVPANKVTDSAETQLHQNSIIGVGDAGTMYAIGRTTLTPNLFDVYKWNVASNTFSQITTFNSGIASSDEPRGMVYDPSDTYFYTISKLSNIERFNPVTLTEEANWITSGFTTYPGANIFLQSQNLMFYDGNKVYTVDKAVPSVTSIFEDGMGPDMLSEASAAGANPLFRNIKLATSTPQGIYYVKNTRQGHSGQPLPWVFRIEKDTAGNWIGNPITELPVGSVALGITFHLGQVLITTTPNWFAALKNDTVEAEIEIYFVGEGGKGALGSILGERDELDETPYAFLGTNGPFVYIGGQKRLWIYDAMRGGLHTAFEWGTELNNGAYTAMAWVEDSAGDATMLFLGADRKAQQKTSKVDNPDTVTNFGDDETHYVLESNYFDGGLPMEEKEITKVAILRDADDGGSEWTVQLSVDDGAFVDVLVDSGTDSYTELINSGIVGRQFRYKLIYQTKDTARKALRALLITMTTGDMVTEWDLLLDGSELYFNNKKQDEEEFYDSMLAIADTRTITTLVDNMQEQAQSSSAQVKVKVVAVEIVKEKPGESKVHILLREAQ